MPRLRSEAKKPCKKFPDHLQWKMTHLTMPSTSTPKRDPKSTKVTKNDIDTAFGFDDSSEAVSDYSTFLSPIAHASPKGIVPPVEKVKPLSQRNVRTYTRRKRVKRSEERDPETEYDFVPKLATEKVVKVTSTESKVKQEPAIVPSAAPDSPKGIVPPVWKVNPLSQRNVRTYGSRSSRKRVHYSEERDPETDYDFVPKVATEEVEKGGELPSPKSKVKRKKTKARKKNNDKNPNDDMDDEAKKWLEEKNKEFEEVLKTKLVIEKSFSD